MNDNKSDNAQTLVKSDLLGVSETSECDLTMHQMTWLH